VNVLFTLLLVAGTTTSRLTMACRPTRSAVEAGVGAGDHDARLLRGELGVTLSTPLVSGVVRWELVTLPRQLALYLAGCLVLTLCCCVSRFVLVVDRTFSVVAIVRAWGA
jgi:hypothetical protein